MLRLLLSKSRRWLAWILEPNRCGGCGRRIPELGFYCEWCRNDPIIIPDDWLTCPIGDLIALGAEVPF